MQAYRPVNGAIGHMGRKVSYKAMAKAPSDLQLAWQKVGSRRMDYDGSN